MPEKNTEINISQEFDKNVVVYTNISSEILIVDLTKLKFIIQEHDSSVKKTGDWVSVLALTVSLILANCTASFSPLFGLSSETWKAIFVLCMIASAVWLLIVVINHVMKRKERSINSLIDRIINESKRVELTR